MCARDTGARPHQCKPLIDTKMMQVCLHNCIDNSYRQGHSELLIGAFHLRRHMDGVRDEDHHAAALTAAQIMVHDRGGEPARVPVELVLVGAHEVRECPGAKCAHRPSVLDTRMCMAQKGDGEGEGRG